MRYLYHNELFYKNVKLAIEKKKIRAVMKGTETKNKNALLA